jgi:hypothetical protein
MSLQRKTVLILTAAIPWLLVTAAQQASEFNPQPEPPARAQETLSAPGAPKAAYPARMPKHVEPGNDDPHAIEPGNDDPHAIEPGNDDPHAIDPARTPAMQPRSGPLPTGTGQAVSPGINRKAGATAGDTLGAKPVARAGLEPVIVQPANDATIMLGLNQYRCINIVARHQPSAECYPDMDDWGKCAWYLFAERQTYNDQSQQFEDLGDGKNELINSNGKTAGGQMCLKAGRHRIRVGAMHYSMPDRTRLYGTYYSDWHDLQAMQGIAKGAIPAEKVSGDRVGGFESPIPGLGSPPGTQPPAVTGIPASVLPGIRTKHPDGSAEQKRPISGDEPGVGKQAALARPLITLPAANARFTTPVSFTARARLAPGKQVTYGIRPQGRDRAVAKSRSGRFSNLALASGGYCVYVTYEPSGPASQCVPFTVRLAVPRAPLAAPQPVSPPLSAPVKSPPVRHRSMEPLD